MKLLADRPLTRERLLEVLSYDPQTGVFRWKIKLSRRNHIGDRAGTIDVRGYRVIQIDGWQYKAGRLAWLYVHGRWPDPLADHRDLNRSNDRISNLREATDSQNKMNVALLKSNTSGFKGVCKTLGNRSKPWRAFIRKDGVRYFIGNFSTREEAAGAYRARAHQLHGEFART